MEIKRIIRSKRRSIGLQINSRGELIIRAPKRISIKKINRVIEKHSNWIRKKIIQAKKQKSEVPQKKFVQGEEFLFLGLKYWLDFRKQNKKIVLDKKNSLICISDKNKKQTKKIIKEWYQNKAEELLINKTNKFAKEKDLKINKAKISWAKKRWGSYSNKSRNINYNWRLIMAPEFVIDYVVIHELVHSKQSNHSQKFWKKVEQMYPEYKKAKKWLKQKGHLLKL